MRLRTIALVCLFLTLPLQLRADTIYRYVGNVLLYEFGSGSLLPSDQITCSSSTLAAPLVPNQSVSLIAPDSFTCFLRW